MHCLRRGNFVENRGDSKSLQAGRPESKIDHEGVRTTRRPREGAIAGRESLANAMQTQTDDGERELSRETATVP